MSKRVRIAVGIFSVVLLLFTAELVREKIVYDIYSARLETRLNSLRPGMDKEEVTRLLSEPDHKASEETGEYWYWLAYQHQGWVYEKLGLAPTKGPPSVYIRFDKQGKIVGFGPAM